MVLLLVLLALLASLVASEQVTERIILASVNGVPSSEVLFGPHHLLTVSSDASGGLKAIYCVDVTCKTTFSSQIWNSATGLPTILPDTGGRAPVLGFQHSDGQVIAFARCSDASCQSLAWSRNAVHSTGLGDVISPGVSLALAASGSLNMLFSRSFGAAGSQCAVVQCLYDAGLFAACSEKTLTVVEPQLCLDVGPDSIATLPDDSFVLLYRNGTSLYVGLCPALPSLCVSMNALLVSPASPPGEAHGLFSHAVGVLRGLPVLAFSVGVTDPFLRLVFCQDAACTTFRVENLGLSSVGVAFAAEGARLMVVAAGDRGMWLLECFVDKVCSPAVKLASSLGNNTVFVPKSVQGGSGGYIAWSVVATDTDSRLHVFVGQDLSGPTCDGQGQDYRDCSRDLGQNCQENNSTIGKEGSCSCLDPWVMDESSAFTTPHGCCVNCSGTKQCWQGACRCRGTQVEGSSRNGSLLFCGPSSSSSPAPALVDGDEDSVGWLVGGLVLGLLLTGLAVLALVWICARKRRREKMSAVANVISSRGDTGANRSAPLREESKQLAPYYEDDNYTADDFL